MFTLTCTVCASGVRIRLIYEVQFYLNEVSMLTCMCGSALKKRIPKHRALNFAETGTNQVTAHEGHILVVLRVECEDESH